MLKIENIILYFLLTSALLSISAIYFHFKRRKSPGALFFSIVSVSIAIWSIGYIVEFCANTIEAKFLGAQIQYTFGIPFTAVLWFSAAVNLRTFGKRPTLKELLLICIIPAITMVLMWTNNFHNLVYGKMWLYEDEHFLLLQKNIGIWYYINIVYSYIMLVFGSLILIYTMKKSKDIFRGQYALFFILAVLPWIANLTYILGMNSFMRVDITPVAFTASLIMVEIANRKFGLFDIVPTAYELIIESMKNGVIVIDSNNRIIKINPYLSDILGSKNYLGENISELLAALNISESILNTGSLVHEAEFGSYYFEITVAHFTGKKKYNSGKIITLYDITKRNKDEKDWKDLNASKDKLFSIIAHDLKNPFFGIIGLSNVFCSEIKSLTQEEIINYAKGINDLAENTYRILENLLDWSRQQTGKMDYSPETFNISEAMTEYLVTIAPQAKLKNVYLQNDFDNKVFVYADSYMIKTVIRNLISNALKFSNPGGEITISVKTNNNVIETSIADTGVGMDKNTLSGLFQIDQNVKSVGTMGERGTGLGLILCNDFVKANGGEIFVKSTIGKGSKFTFTLPVKGQIPG
nr:histidine kinase N-terminal 7TM domain-containing protein [uncultured Sphaerochaeta sp.]